jgi:hypothetical protein
VIWVWIVLVIALLLMLAAFAVWLFRKLIAVLQEFSDLVGRTAILDGVHRSEPEPREFAVLGGTAAATARWRSLRHDGRRRKGERRSARLKRARGLLEVDATSIKWFRR